MELLLWFSVDGDTMVGGVDDSYPELAAGEGCDAGLLDSWTCDRKIVINMNLIKANMYITVCARVTGNQLMSKQ